MPHSRPRTFDEQVTLPPVEPKEVRQRVDNAHKTGFQDAVNETVNLAQTQSGKRVLKSAMNGDPKPYRRAMDRRREKPFG